MKTTPLALILLAAASLAACGGAEEDGIPSTASAARSDPDRPNPSPSGRSDDARGGTTIRIALDGTAFTGQLADTPTARDLVGQLPLTLTFRDHNGVEKTGPLPRELSLDRAPDSHDPSVGEIGYYSPGNDLVFYYDDAPAFGGIVPLGHFDADAAALERHAGDVMMTIDRAK